MSKIVILGGGIGGVAAGLGLARKFRRDKNISLTLVDKNNYQLFNSNLYEAATADEELVSQKQLKKSIAVPFGEIFKNTTVDLVKAEITQIDAVNKTVTAGVKKLEYDYLVLALGSTTDYFGVEGAEQFSLPLKSLADAMRIRNQIEFAVQARRQDVNKPNIRVVVAGGGYTGCEFAAELASEIKIIAWKNNYPPEKIEICLIEAGSQVVGGFSEKLSQDVLWRLKECGVRVVLSSPIAKVTQNFVETGNGEKTEYDVLVWTTGVKAKTLPFTKPMELDKKGRIVTNEFLQTKDNHFIFALGDIACITNQDGHPAPPTAQDAIKHGRYLAYALPLIMQNKRPKSYLGQKHGFIVGLGGKWAIMDYAGFYFTGWLAYLFREGANFRYYASVVGWWKAIKHILFQMDMYSRND